MLKHREKKRKFFFSNIIRIAIRFFFLFEFKMEKKIFNIQFKWVRLLRLECTQKVGENTLKFGNGTLKFFLVNLEITGESAHKKMEMKMQKKV